MKFTDKRFWIFEAFAILATVITFGLIIITPMIYLDIIPFGIITLISYIIGYAAAWKSSKSSTWTELGFCIYSLSIVAFAIILAILITIDYVKVSDDISHENIHSSYGTFLQVILGYWFIISLIPALFTGWIASLCLKTKKIKVWAFKEISLESIGVNGVAYHRDEALLIAQEYFNSGRPILGGDVYKVMTGQIESTSDSWYCDQNGSETPYEYLVRSYHIACDYICKYPNTPNTLFNLVIG
ncbi:MAG: hypothetical protein K2M11_05145 [Paramuribaculum sp.]|nr:hypothetical protein [Paramuribaculum sp.]